jgi:hypothetical protein
MTDKGTIHQTATTIAERLGETEAVPRHTITRVLKHLGVDRTLALLEEALDIEANGGMILPDGSRRRTPGGVFFWLIKERLFQAGQKNVVAKIFWKPRGEGSVAGVTPKIPPAPVFTWDERGMWLGALGEAKGVVKTVKVTLIGRPDRVVEQQSFTLLRMQHSGPLPSLPKGIPVPAKVPITTYIVYIGAKQWRGVTEALKNEEDTLIVEGTQMYDAEHRAIAVFATSTTTKLLQQAKRAQPSSG